jgi:hypothetical protein
MDSKGNFKIEEGGNIKSRIEEIEKRTNNLFKLIVITVGLALLLFFAGVAADILLKNSMYNEVRTDVDNLEVKIKELKKSRVK